MDQGAGKLDLFVVRIMQESKRHQGITLLHDLIRIDSTEDRKLRPLELIPHATETLALASLSHAWIVL